MARAKGEVSAEERVLLDARIAELGVQLEEARVTERQLAEETKSVRGALQAAMRQQVELSKAVAETQARIDEQLLQTRSGEDAVRRAVREKEEALVSSDLLKLEVRRLRDSLSSRSAGVFGAENTAAQLACTVEGRKREIAAHKAVQRTSAKLAEEERHRLAVDLTDRTARVGLLRAKYAALCAKVRGGGGEGEGEPRSQAYYVLAAAQKREELQREGDELDGLCKKAERECRAMASALGYLNDRNDALRKAFAPPTGEGEDEVGTVRALEAAARDAQDALFRRKRELAGLNATVEDAAASAEAAGERSAALAAQLGVLEEAARRAAGEAAAGQRAVAVAAAGVVAARTRHRSKRGGPGSAPTPDEIAFVAQGIREAGAAVLYTLGALAREFPSLSPALGALTAERGLRVPARPPSRVPSRSGPPASAPSPLAGLALPPAATAAQAAAPLPRAVVGGSGAAAVAALSGRATSAGTTGTAGSGRRGTPKAPSSAQPPAPAGLDLGVAGSQMGRGPQPAAAAAAAGRPPRR